MLQTPLRNRLGVYCLKHLPDHGIGGKWPHAREYGRILRRLCVHAEAAFEAATFLLHTHNRWREQHRKVFDELESWLKECYYEIFATGVMSEIKLSARGCWIVPQKYLEMVPSLTRYLNLADRIVHVLLQAWTGPSTLMVNVQKPIQRNADKYIGEMNYNLAQYAELIANTARAALVPLGDGSHDLRRWIEIHMRTKIRFAKVLLSDARVLEECSGNQKVLATIPRLRCW